MSLYETWSDTIQPVTLLLKGDSGTGKTWKASHFPKPVFFNFDGNMVGVNKLPDAVKQDIKVVNPAVDMDNKPIAVTKFWDNFMQKLGLVAEDPDTKTIVIDSLSTMADRLHWQLICVQDPKQKPKGYDFWAYYKNHIQFFIDKVIHNPELDKHVVVIAHTRLEKDELSGNISRELALDGSMKDRMALHFSDVWECFARAPVGQSLAYKVRTVPGPNFTAKCSLDLPEEFEFDAQKDNMVKQLTALTSKPEVTA